MKKVIKELENKYRVSLSLIDGVNDDDEPEILIQREDLDENGERGSMKSYKAAKSLWPYAYKPDLEISSEEGRVKAEAYLEGKIVNYLEGKSSYKNLSKEFSKIIKDVGFYATTYGIGTHIAFDSDEAVRKKIKPVLDFLDSGKIDYDLQYSEAMWVYKIVFSKSKENLKRLGDLSKKGGRSPKM